MQDYARGVTETRFDVSCKIQSFNTWGALVKVRNATHRLEFTKGRFRSSAEGTEAAAWTGSFETHGSRGPIGLETYADTAVFFPIFAFAPGARQKFDFETASAPANGVAVSFRSLDACRTFEPRGKGFGLTKGDCENGQFVLDESGPVPLRGSFSGLGFPVSAGKEVLNGYRAETEFAEVPLAGAKRPFLFPKRVKATFAFGTGDVTVDCGYALHTGKK